MPLSKSELLKSRYIVEAPMPGAQFSHFLPGDILEEKDHSLYQSGTVWGHADETDVCKWTTICPNYPHLFRPLPWYEKREIEDMPEYLSYTSGIYKAFWSVDDKGIFLLKIGDLINKYPIWFYSRSLQPATPEEYEAYINSKIETK